MKKIMITGAWWMLAHDFHRYCSEEFEIIGYTKDMLDITDKNTVEKVITAIAPDCILNCAAYTAVDDAENIDEARVCYDVNTLWVYNLAHIAARHNIDFITISTDYVFDGKKEEGYHEHDVCHPINTYGLSKSLWERLALLENKNTIIIRTSWLYGWWIQYRNFVNTMIHLWKEQIVLKVINDQFWAPTYTKDLSMAISQVIHTIGQYEGNILHFCDNVPGNGITWYDFASEIFLLLWENDIHLSPSKSAEYSTKASRPTYSKLINNSNIQLRDWREGLREYLQDIAEVIPNTAYKIHE